MIKAIFFDLDGTLCDSDSAWEIAQTETFQLLCERYPDVSERTLTEAWEKVHQEQFQRLHAGEISMATVRDSRFGCLFKELGLPTDVAPERFNDFLSSRYLTNLRLYEDVKVLDALRTFHVGIITNGAHDTHTDSQLTKVQRLGLSNRIQSLTISDEIGVRKPNVEIFKVACERAGVLPSAAMFIGDTVANDIVGANRAGMLSVFINRKSEVMVPQTADERPDADISNLCEVLCCFGRK